MVTAKKILAVDDEPFNLELIELTFSEIKDITFLKARNGREALEILEKELSVDAVLLDLAMPVLNGFETLKIIKADERFMHIPVVVVTANKEEKTKALQMGANDFISKPYDIEELKLRTLNYVEIKRYNDILKNMNQLLEEKVNERTQALQETLKAAKETEYEISLRLGKASEFRDIETGMHIVRTSYFSQKLAELYGLSSEEAEIIRYASPLHDVGKIGVPDRILLKPGKLTDKEFEKMKLHTVIGGRMLENAEKYPVIESGRIIALQHHEKWDGSGYPNGLQGNDIHIYGRIVAIMDVFDALSSKRVYRPTAFPLEKTLSFINEGRGKHFDPKLVDLFVNSIDAFLQIKNDFPDEDETPFILQLFGPYEED